MSSPVYRISQLLSRLLQGVRVGTNLDLFLRLWTLLRGRLLASRGALFPALADFGLSDFGLSDDAVRRAEAALARGQWSIADLIESFEQEVAAGGRFPPHTDGGFHPVAGDRTAFFRPSLQACPTKPYCAAAGQALPAIRLGILGQVGSVGAQRWARPVALVRADPDDPSEPAHRKRLLREAKAKLEAADVLVLDRGVPLAELLASGIDRFGVRLPTTFTVRRATPPAYPG